MERSVLLLQTNLPILKFPKNTKAVTQFTTNPKKIFYALQFTNLRHIKKSNVWLAKINLNVSSQKV